MAIQKTVPLLGGFSANYIQFDRWEFWSKRQKRAHAIFAIFVDADAAAAYAADPTNPLLAPVLADGVRVEVKDADFEACFPDLVSSSAGAYTMIKNYPVCMWHKSDTSSTAAEDRLMYGAVDV